MKKYIRKLYYVLLLVVNSPLILSVFLNKNTGKQYNISFVSKICLLTKMIRNNHKIPSASHWLEHITIVTRILNVPKSIEGAVVECGSYKGGSAANLSLACALCGRKLEIFDSFEGLPCPLDIDRVHYCMDINQAHVYMQGSWRATLDEVRKNISKYGKINVCNFHAGYFNETLRGEQKRCIAIFLDVDLRDSLETCIKHLWPRLCDGGYLFTHEAQHMEIASLFFDKDWWHNVLNCSPPGLMGAGSGLGFFPSAGGFKSAIGYTIKNPDIENYMKIPQIGL